MSVICHIDGSEHESVADVHALLKSLRIKRETYYHTHEPRYDRATGVLIPYKDLKQYRSQEFADKESLKKWIHTNPVEGKAWAIDWLRKRKEEKSLVYAPSQVELESLCCPSMRYYDWVGGYYAICRDLGFRDRYADYPDKKADIMSESTPNVVGIIQDSREQTPIKLGVKTTVSKLDWGDYALVNDPFKVRIERKSLHDMIGTLSGKKVEHKRIAQDSPCERFERELIRAKEDGGYLVMMVESTIEDALNFRELSSIKHGKASPSYIFKNLRDLLIKYPLTWQVVFVGDHKKAAEKLIKIFQMGNQVKRVDLQYALQRGVL